MAQTNKTQGAPKARPANSGVKSGSKRRRKRKNPNNYLYIAITLIFVFMALATVLICIMVGCDEDEGSQGESSESKITSTPESSIVINESSSVIQESTLPDSESSVGDTSSPSKLQSVSDYEKFIGVEYAIDMTDYEQYVCPENEKDFVFLVNPSHPLASDYVPENLVWCTNIREGRPEAWSYIDATANKALEAFLAEAEYYGFDDITVTNAYRSYNSQSSIFKRYFDNDIKQDYVCDTCSEYFDISYYPNKVTTVPCCNSCKGELTEIDGERFCESCMSVADEGKKAVCAKCGSEVRRPTESEAEAHVLTYSTKPGTSEHQSGLCCDMHNLPDTTSAFDNTPEAIWLAENAHRFGFILRYPPNTQHITGIKHESWHFRYVGRTAATEIYQKGITLDEYCE